MLRLEQSHSVSSDDSHYRRFELKCRTLRPARRPGFLRRRWVARKPMSSLAAEVWEERARATLSMD